MGAANKVVIDAFLTSVDSDVLELTRLKETADSVYLGAVGLDRTTPIFHSIAGFNFSGQLSPDASFRVERVMHPRHRKDVHVVIFRQFNASRYQDQPEDIIAGWYSDEMRANGDAMVATMTCLLGKLLTSVLAH